MLSDTNNRSNLVRVRVSNMGCIGPEGLEIALDDIVCLVGPNNSGKSTVLRAYESAVDMLKLSPEDFNSQANGLPITVELWVHIPAGIENIAEKWKEAEGELLLVRSKWEWSEPGESPTRSTWDPESEKYAADGNAAGLDHVFTSRLPKPFRIGSLQSPEEEHKKLLTLVLEPIKNRLAEMMRDETSPVNEKLKQLQQEAEKPVAEFRTDLDKVEARVNLSYRHVFQTAEIKLQVALGDLGIDLGKSLIGSSHIGLQESHGEVKWSQQGTGSQRALFWSMLEVRSELVRLDDERKNLSKILKAKKGDIRKLEKAILTVKKESSKQEKRDKIAEIKEEIKGLEEVGAQPDGTGVEAFLPGYMLLIDEPETALHPSAVRAAKSHLYSLAQQAGWQVMLTTHHPAFVDPLEDHTTIVRLSRPDEHCSPNTYRADDVQFTDDERDNLKCLARFDATLAEMFFGSQVIIVEGDTEYAAFSYVMDSNPEAYPDETRPLIIRARGKATIPPLAKMLQHFKLSFSVLHDIDSPRTKTGKKANSAYAVNESITAAINDARDAGVTVTHRSCCPEFERHHGMELSSKNKPFEAWDAVRSHPDILSKVRATLDELAASPEAEAFDHPDDGRHFELKLKEWVEVNTERDPRYQFAATQSVKAAEPSASN